MSRTLDAEIHVANPTGELRPGMYGRGVVVTGVHEHVPVIPVSALQVSSKGRFVYVLKADKVERRAVNLGVDGDTWLEVTGGLTGGEEVVSAGVDVISDGVQVRVARNLDPITGAPLTAPTVRSHKEPMAAPVVR